MRNSLEAYDVEVKVIEKHVVTVHARSPHEAIELASANYAEGLLTKSYIGDLKILDVTSE